MELFLRERLIEKTGLSFLRHKDCDILADEIEKEINERVSSSSLKRILGVVKSTSTPSKQTLHILALFLGYDSLEAFENDRENDGLNESPKPSPLTDLFEWMTEVGEKSAQDSWRNRFINAESLLLRKRETKKWHEFLTTEATFFPLVATAGSGKSVITYQCWQWIRENHPESPCFYVHGNDIERHLSHLCATLFEDETSVAMNEWLRSNPDKNIFLLIDGLDEIQMPWQKVSRIIRGFLETAKRMYPSRRWKLMMSMRPNIWTKMNQDNLLDSMSGHVFWSIELERGVLSENISSLDDEEIATILKNAAPKSTRKPDLNNFDRADVELLRNPYYCQLMAGLFARGQSKIKFNFVHHLFEHYLFESDTHGDVILYINTLMRHMLAQDQEKHPVPLSTLLSLHPHLSQIHKYLLEQGVVMEKKNDSAFSSQITVEFRHSLFYDYALAFYLYFEQPISEERLLKLIEKYYTHSSFSFLMSQWIWFTLQQSRLDLTTAIFTKSEHLVTFLKEGVDSVDNPRPLAGFILRTVAHLPDVLEPILEQHISNPNIRYIFFEKDPHIEPTNHVMKRLYKRYLEESDTHNDKMFVASLLLRIALANDDIEEIKHYSTILDDLGLNLKQSHLIPNTRSLAYRLYAYPLLGKDISPLTSRIPDFTIERRREFDLAFMPADNPILFVEYYKYLYPAAILTKQWTFLATEYERFNKWANFEENPEIAKSSGILVAQIMLFGGAWMHTKNPKLLKRARELYAFWHTLSFVKDAGDSFFNTTVNILFARIANELNEDESQILMFLDRAQRSSESIGDKYYLKVIRELKNELIDAAQEKLVANLIG